MLAHKDAEIQAMLELLESQRDQAMRVVAALSKENAELKARLAELVKEQQSGGVDG